MLDLTAPWHSARLLAVDVEGNGARPPELVELGIVPIIDGVIGQTRTWMVRPPSGITWQATKVHGITNEQVGRLERVADVAEEIRAALGTDTVLIAHNAHVDLDVITRELHWEPAAVVDTLKLSRRLDSGQRSHRLGALVEAHRLDQDMPEGSGPHRAGYDALMAARLLLRLIGDAGLATLGQITEPAPATAPEALF